MYDVIVHDLRVEGTCPSGHFTVIRVDGRTALNSMVTRIRRASIAHGTDIRLKILAHGFETGGRGGLGIQICRENLTLPTVHTLRPLNGYISYGIDIYSCAAADTSPWRVGMSGDGWLLCSRIASVTGSVVRAAVLTQYYSNSFLGIIQTPIDFGAWEGPVLTFDPRGAEVARQMSPER